MQKIPVRVTKKLSKIQLVMKELLIIWELLPLLILWRLLPLLIIWLAICK